MTDGKRVVFTGGGTSGHYQMNGLLHFCSELEARDILGNFAREFSAGFNQHCDFYARNIDPNTKDARSEYINGLENSALGFKQNERSVLDEHITEAIEFIRLQFPQIRLDTPVQIVKFRPEHEAAAFGLSNGVAFDQTVLGWLTNGRVDNVEDKGARLRLIAHELFHVIDAQNPSLLSHVAPFFGYSLPLPVRTSVQSCGQIFSNPDINEDFVTEIAIDGQNRSVLPVYWYNGHENPNPLQESFKRGWLGTAFIELESVKGKLITSSVLSPALSKQAGEAIRERFHGLPVNILALPELTAELFGMYYSWVEKGHRVDLYLSQTQERFLCDFIDQVMLFR